MKTNAWKRHNRGFTLLEVLIGIVIFALGMMALAQLQSSLARNSTDSNARTVATNIAEELIESARSFSQITKDPAGIKHAYNDIETGAQIVTRGANTFAVATQVTDYYYAGDSFTTEPPLGAARSDMKLLEVTVTWNAEEGGTKFYVDGSPGSETGLGTGSITLRDVISSITSPSSGKVALGAAGDNSYSPPVDYNPGENPDIVSIELGANKFKESTTPLPDVIRTDELVETRFDVVTYSQNGDNATFLRREEFRAISCECTLRIPSGDSQGGLRPTVWTGSEYSEGEFVSKPYGEQANNQQSEFCGICCRDHHDGGIGENDDGNDPGRSHYNPFAQAASYYDATHGALAGDHQHFSRSNTGEPQLAASDGAPYVEACRMVRKDGFWRIAQDLRQEGLNSFPGTYLDEEAEVGEYSDYVTDAVLAYELATDPSNNLNPSNPYESAPPVFMLPLNMSPAVVFPASTYDNATEMASGGVTEQQLRARGIYIDYMNDELRNKINCLDLPGSSGEACGVPEVTTSLEIIPFYDVQLTWLARWNETPNNNPIDVSNEAISNANTHSRGVASLQSGFGYSTVNSAIHKGNLGLTGTDPIDPWYAFQTRAYDLYALAVDFDTPPALTTIIVAGTISSAVGGVKAADVEIVGVGAACDRTLTGFECVVEKSAASPRIEVSNYFKQGKTLLACSTYLAGIPPIEHFATNGNNRTKFALPTNASTSVADIVIKENGCN